MYGGLEPELRASARDTQVCARCVMDTSAPDIRFDKDGICNYCTEYIVTRGRFLETDPVARQERLDRLLKAVREAGRGKPYDCIIGVSGGVDSSWVLALAVDHGLRPLAVHMDNDLPLFAPWQHRRTPRHLIRTPNGNTSSGASQGPAKRRA